MSIRLTLEGARRQRPTSGSAIAAIYEILDGEIYMTPAPSPSHQYTSKRLRRVLEDYFERQRQHVVFDAPIDVILADDDVLQPDLVVAPRPQISRRGIEGAPALIVEILSPSRHDYDRLTKARRCAVRGVPQFWIVDTEARSIECFQLRAAVYQLEATAAADQELSPPSFARLTFPLAGLWLDH